MSHLPNHLSWTSLSTYTRCSLKWRFHYLDREEEEFAPAARVFGQAIHEAIGAFLQSTLNGESLRPGDLVDVYRQIWLSHDGPKVKYGARDSEDSLLTKAKGLLALFCEQHDPAAQVIAVEEAFTVDLEEILPDHPYPLPQFVGYIDAILQQNGSTALVDYKTAARKPNGSVDAAQLHGYSLGAAAMGYDPDELDFRFDYLIKTANPDLVSRTVQVNQHDRTMFLKSLTRVWRAIQTAIFYQKRGHQRRQNSRRRELVCYSKPKYPFYWVEFRLGYRLLDQFHGSDAYHRAIESERVAPIIRDYQVRVTAFGSIHVQRSCQVEPCTHEPSSSWPEPGPDVTPWSSCPFRKRALPALEHEKVPVW